MPLYKGSTKVYAVRGNCEPVALYKGGVKITGWQEYRDSGIKDENNYVNKFNYTYNEIITNIQIFGEYSATSLNPSPTSPAYLDFTSNFRLQNSLTPTPTGIQALFSGELRAFPTAVVSQQISDKFYVRVRREGKSTITGSSYTKAIEVLDLSTSNFQSDWWIDNTNSSYTIAQISSYLDGDSYGRFVYPESTVRAFCTRYPYSTSMTRNTFFMAADASGSGTNIKFVLPKDSSLTAESWASRIKAEKIKIYYVMGMSSYNFITEQDEQGQITYSASETTRCKTYPFTTYIAQTPALASAPGEVNLFPSMGEVFLTAKRMPITE